MRLRELRLEKGLTLSKLAGKLFSSEQVLSRYETGQREPDIEMLTKLANYFGCSIDYLVGRSDDFGNINTNADLSSEESEIIETFRSLTSDRDKTLFLLFVRNMQPASFAKKYKKPDETHRA